MTHEPALALNALESAGGAPPPPGHSGLFPSPSSIPIGPVRPEPSPGQWRTLDPLTLLAEVGHDGTAVATA